MFNTAQFMQFRQHNTTQWLPSDDPSAPAIMVASHIWWTDFIALALHQMGYNVLLTAPLYLLFTDDGGWRNFESLYDQFLDLIKRYKVRMILGGNSSAMAPHRRTGVLLHEAAGVPVVHYWWDEPRTAPPCAKHFGTPEDYLGHLKNARTLNVWWDVDVCEEMAEFFGVGGIHVPLATLADFWPDTFIPLEARRLAACFLGNCHGNTAHTENRADPLLEWANTVVDHKLADLHRPMTACIQMAGAQRRARSADASSAFVTTCPGVPIAATDPWGRHFLDWELINLVYAHRTRNRMVKALCEKWPEYVMLIGKGWEQLGLKAAKEHSGLPAAGEYYASSRASVNLFGGCVHGGMPLRPYEIAASHGLIITHDNRELPDLFEPGKECLSFRNAEEMNGHVERLVRDPKPYNGMIAAARKRTLAEHTWQHRLRVVLDAVQEKFGAL